MTGETAQTGKQWCVVRGCVALADSPHVPFLCRTHGAMTKAERDEWSQEHSFQKPELRSILCRVEYQRADGSVFGYDDEGRTYEGTWGKHWYPARGEA